jgi:hypothetical protein
MAAMANLVDEREVLALTGEACPADLAAGIAKKWYPGPVKGWELDGLKPDGRKNWRWRPRWSRLAVMQAVVGLKARQPVAGGA